MKQNKNDNAANRASYIGEVYDKGSDVVKEEVLASMPNEWADLHRKGYIHIHDLDAYGKTYNCLTFNFVETFPYELFYNLSDSGKIVRVFGYIKTLLEDMGNEQSGGMAFANFDNELANVFSELKVQLKKANLELIKECIGDLILWCNNTHTRMGQTSYYVTFNIGLASTEFARKIAEYLIEQYESSGDSVYKPNIVFKVCGGISRFESDANFDLLKKSLLCTAKKMIPTYLLCDCALDKGISPEKLSVMGCRTRVVDDVFGSTGAIGRGNICNISINLPRIAMEIDKEYKTVSAAEKLEFAYAKWEAIASIVKNILLDRYDTTLSNAIEDFPINGERQLWCEKFGSPKDVLKHGTLSIGFIGLSEFVEVLSGCKFYADSGIYQAALDFVSKMRAYCDLLRDSYRLNFSLLATSGELISGRFCELDRERFSEYNTVLSKGFYTNSFHVNVDSGLSAREKIEKEGAFHIYCNGGSITYIELNEAPLGNAEGLRELVELSIESGIRYLGVNFPKDICNDCKSVGVFDICPCCNSKNIMHIRRVSGYLEQLDGFTSGKKQEERLRKGN